MQPFHWTAPSTTTVSATTTTSTSALLNTPTGADFQVRFYNAGSVPVFVKFGASTVTATTANLPMAPGAVEVLTIRNTLNDPITHIAAITGSSTATLYVTVGSGI